MHVVKKARLNVFLVFTLLLSLILPGITFADEVDKPVIIGDVDHPTLTIHKFEQEPGTDQGEAGTGLPDQNAEGDPVEGVTYTLTQTHQYDAASDEWTEVTDGPVIEGTTGSNGTIVFTKDEGIELGRYEVQETDGPSHIILNPDTFFVDIPMTSKDGTTLNYDVHIYPKNEIIRGDAELIKVGEDGNVLPGVVFGLYEEDGTLIEELTTDSEGKINVSGLAQGQYYFQEISTVDGYALNTDEIYFEVKAGEQNTVEWTPNEGYVDEDGVVTNYKTPEIEKDVEEQDHYDVDRDQEFVYNVTITTPGDIANYKSLGVTDTLDPRLEYAGTWTVTGTDAENINFSTVVVNEGEENETVKLIWEVDDLSQLLPNEAIKITFSAKIKPDAELELDETGIPNEAELDFDNDKGEITDPEDPPTTPPVIVTPTEGGLKVIKVDKNDHDITLEGAQFKLTTDPEGNDVVDASGTVITVGGEVHDGLLENLVTNADGEILIEGLTPGTYYLHETKAPTYTDEEGNEQSYRLLTKPIEIEVVNSSENKEVTVENSKSGWELPTTGGIGTILFTVIGLALMTTAYLLYVRRRRAEQVV